MLLGAFEVATTDGNDLRASVAGGVISLVVTLLVEHQDS